MKTSHSLKPYGSPAVFPETEDIWTKLKYHAAISLLGMTVLVQPEGYYIKVAPVFPTEVGILFGIRERFEFLRMLFSDQDQPEEN